uniref:Mas-related G-protein coupled receptor member X2-like n=1 Tax=Cricetulus griseus TaxID=10029 RepID=A0A8C2MDZ3_CRIGR
MEESHIVGDLRVNSNTADFETNIIVVNGRNNTEISFCNIMSYTMIWLSLIIGLIGLVGNAVVLWLLGFHMQRNGFSVYILNLAGSIVGSRGTLSRYFCREPCRTPLKKKTVEWGLLQEDPEK